MENRLAEMRKVHLWSQAELAEQLQVSWQTIISIERGRFDPSLPLAFRIARLFDCAIEDVFQPGARDPQPVGQSIAEQVQ